MDFSAPRQLYEPKRIERPSDWIDGLDSAVDAAIVIDNDFGGPRESLDRFLDALERLRAIATTELIRICSKQPSPVLEWLGLPNRSILHDIHVVWCELNDLQPVEIRQSEDRQHFIAVSIGFLDEILEELRSEISSPWDKTRKIKIALEIGNQCSKYRGSAIKY